MPWYVPGCFKEQNGEKVDSKADKTVPTDLEGGFSLPSNEQRRGEQKNEQNSGSEDDVIEQMNNDWVKIRNSLHESMKVSFFKYKSYLILCHIY